MAIQDRLEFRDHQDQWDQLASKGQRGSPVSPAQPCLSYKMGTCVWFICPAQLERRESLGPRASGCLGSRVKQESVDSRGRRGMLGIQETLEHQASQGSLGYLESLGFEVLQDQKEKRVMDALPALACRGR